jgi:cytochrome c-type biogenesis protein
MENVALPFLAVVAGILSFSSPCCLPLLPGYLSYVSALPVSELGAPEARRVTLRAALLFVAGFTTVFTTVGVVAALVFGSLRLPEQGAVVRVVGVVIIILGLSTAGVLRIPFLMRERRMDLNRVPRGTAWAFPMGMAFAAGWVPCLGPILGTITGIAATTGTAWWGGVLLLLYSAGLGIPFVLLALGFNRASRSLAWLRRNGRRLEIGGGLVLVVVGLLFLTGMWQDFFLPLQRWFARLGWPPV